MAFDLATHRVGFGAGANCDARAVSPGGGGLAGGADFTDDGLTALPVPRPPRARRGALAPEGQLLLLGLALVLGWCLGLGAVHAGPRGVGLYRRCTLSWERFWPAGGGQAGEPDGRASFVEPFTRASLVRDRADTTTQNFPLKAGRPVETFVDVSPAFAAREEVLVEMADIYGKAPPPKPVR